MRSSASPPRISVVLAALLMLSGCAGGPRHVARVRAIGGQHLPRGEKREPLQPARDATPRAGYQP